MSLYKHISKNKFYEVLEKRLHEYQEALFGDQVMFAVKLQMIQSSESAKAKIKAVDNQIELFGNGFWGYGINSISDGNNQNSHLDVYEIKKQPGRNKSHENYRFFLLMIFKIELNSLYVNVFNIDTCGVGFNTNLNIKFDLISFINSELKLRGGDIFIDLIFKDVLKPISFQVENYMVGGNLSGMELAKYYIDNITTASNKAKLENNIQNSGNLSNNLNDKIDKIELKLRTVIADILVEKSGKNDFESLLSGESKRDVRSRIKSHLEINPDKTSDDFKLLKNASQFLDIDHLKKMIIKDEHWDYFSSIFRDKEKVERYFKQFSELRHSVKHSREITELVRLEGNAAITWLELVVK